MPIEPDFDFIDSLDPANPIDDDPVLEGAAHLRGIKNALQGSVLGDVDSTRLLVDGDIGLRVEADGTSIRSPLTDKPLLAFRNQLDDADFAQIFYDDATDSLVLTSAAGSVALEFAGVDTMRTIAAGLSVAPVGVDGRINIQDNTGATAASLRGLATGVELRSTILDQLIKLIALGGAGNVSVLEGDPNGEAQLMFAGLAKFITKTAGWDSPGTTFDLGQQTDNSILLRLVNLVGGIRFILSSGSGDPGINQLDNAGNFEQTWINFARGGNVALNFAGALALRTRTFGSETTGQHRVTEALPLNNADVTRKDYVDTRSRSNAGDERIEVQNRMILSSTQAPVGQNFTVTFSTPFTSTPNVTLTALNPSNAANGFAYINTIGLNSFTGTVGASGLTVHWIAVGANARGL